MRKLIFGQNNRTAQQDDLRKRYDAGHLIADSLGGPADVRNLVPMFWKPFNRNPGTWYKMETYLRKCINHNCFESGAMSVRTTYNTSADGIRNYIPTSFSGFVTVCKKSGTPKCRTVRIEIIDRSIKNATPGV